MAQDPWVIIIIAFAIVFVLSKFGDRDDMQGPGVS